MQNTQQLTFKIKYYNYNKDRFYLIENTCLVNNNSIYISIIILLEPKHNVKLIIHEGLYNNIIKFFNSVIDKKNVH